MPFRTLSRGDTWLFPPTLDELVRDDHPARFVGAFVEALDRAAWAKLEISLVPQSEGAAAYDPRGLLAVWLYGFMIGTRSSRKLEMGCRDQLSFLWLTGWQHPDHNTLWRFYQAHRQQMRELFKRTIRVAVKAGLVDLAVQAVDGTKVKANAAKERTYDQDSLEKLLERTEAAIKDLEAQNETGGDPPPPRLPETLVQKQALLEQVSKALAEVRAEDGPKQVNLTDGDAQLMKGRQGFVAGYNAQAMVSSVTSGAAGQAGGGLFITATEVSDSPADQEQLVPMIEQAEANTDQPAGVTLADGGYHSGPNLAACAEEGHSVVMPESNRPPRQAPESYGPDAFRYSPETDTYTCPQDQTMRFVGEKHAQGRPVRRVYRASRAICLACPAFGTCTTNRRHGRMLEVGPQDHALRAHRAWIATNEARTLYRRRKQLPEPTFGIMKEQQDARRFLLRGLRNVQAEWSLLATAFNLRTLARLWAAARSQHSLAGSLFTGAAI